MDLFSPLKEKFKNALFNSLITRKIFSLIQEVISLIYQVVHYHKDWDFEEYTQKYHEAFNQTLFV